MRAHLVYSAVLFGLIACSGLPLSGQCPEITDSYASPSDCIQRCTLCVGDVLTLSASGVNLPNGKHIRYYYDEQPGFDPYQGEGTHLGDALIQTAPTQACQPPVQLIGFMIDACGPEAQNEFMVFDVGGGFQVDQLAIDFDMHNNGGAGNDDLGNGFPCGFQPGNPGLVSGCPEVYAIGPGGYVPAGSILVVFTSAGASTVYDMSGICTDCRPVYVVASTCTRTKGAFSNHTSTGTRTTTWTISCGSSGSETYDCATLSGDGDHYLNGTIANDNCKFTGVADPFQLSSTVADLTWTVPADWCGKEYEIVGVVEDWMASNCCADPYTERFTVYVACPKAHETTLEACDDRTGTATFDLTEIEDDVLQGQSGTVRWYADPNATIPISSPYTTGTTTIYAVVEEGPCSSPPAKVQLVVRQAPNYVDKLLVDVCEDTYGSGIGQIDLMIYASLITYNNPALQVLFFQDDQYLVQITQNPYTVSNGEIIYYQVTDGVCTWPGTMQVTVRTLPAVWDAYLEFCEDPPGSGTKVVNLRDYATMFSAGNPQNLRFYTDKDPQSEIPMPTTIESGIYYTRSFDGLCYSEWAELVVEVLPVAGDTLQDTLLLCPDIEPDAYDPDKNRYERANITEASLRGRLPWSGTIEFYSDSNWSVPFRFPATVSDTIVYAKIFGDTCGNRYMRLVLQTIMYREISGLHHMGCYDTLKRALFEVGILREVFFSLPTHYNYAHDSMMDRFDSLYTFELSEDSTFRHTFDTTYYHKDTVIYGRIGIRGCDSFIVPIYLGFLEDTFYIPPIADTVVCDSFVLPSVNTALPSGTMVEYLGYMGGHLVGTFSPGEVIRQSMRFVLFASNASCSMERFFRVTVLHSVDAGRDTSLQVCMGDTVVLAEIRQRHPMGRLVSASDSLRLNGDTLTTNGLDTGVYVVWYVVDDTMACVPDTARVEIHVSDQLDAGPDFTLDTSLCVSDTLDVRFSEYQIASGGRLYRVQGSKVQPVGDGAKVVGGVLGVGDHLLYYVVGEGGRCPPDTVVIRVKVRDTLVLFPDDTIVSCGYYVLPDWNEPVYFLADSAQGQVFYPGDTLYRTVDLVPIDDNQEYCLQPSGGIHVRIHPLSYSQVVDTLCEGDSLMVGGMRFDQTRPMGTVTVPRANRWGCDSIVSVRLYFKPKSRTRIDTILCPGEFLLIGSTRYDASHASGIEVLQNSSGCDSLVEVELEYYDTDTLITGSYCANQRVQIGGRDFDITHPSDTLVLPGASRGGCDSILYVQLSFSTVQVERIKEAICEGDTIYINGKPYYRGRERGRDTLIGGSKNGCDSVLDVAVTVLPLAQSTYRDTLCPDDVVQIGPEVFGIDRRRGTVVLDNAADNGCDSVVEVSLEFYEYSFVLQPDRVKLHRGDSAMVEIITDAPILAIRWQPTEGLHCTDCRVVLLTPVRSTVYRVEITDDNGCVWYLELPVEVSTVETGVYVPNAFTPNGDGINDVFRIETNEPVVIDRFEIYSRWGERLYAESDVTTGIGGSHKGWDGRFDGQQVMPGVYLYYIQWSDATGRLHTEVGTVTLVR